VLNFNGRNFIVQCVRSVLSSRDPNFEIIVVDNASTDGSYEIARKSFAGKRVRLIRNRRNLGFAAGNNVGFNKSSGKIVIFLNADTRVKPNWLVDVRRALSPDQIGAAQCKLISSRDFKLDSLGGYLDSLGYVYSLGAWYPLHPSRFAKPFYAEGAALAVKRSAVREVLLNGEPFDPDCFFFYDDSDLCWRLRLRGFGITVARRSEVYHYRGYSTQRNFPSVVLESSKNHISTLIKNYGSKNLIHWLPLLIFLELLRGIAYAREPASALAKFKGIFWCLRNLRPMWRKRTIVQRLIRRVPDSEIVRLLLPPDFTALFRSV